MMSSNILFADLVVGQSEVGPREVKPRYFDVDSIKWTEVGDGDGHREQVALITRHLIYMHFA